MEEEEKTEETSEGSGEVPLEQKFAGKLGVEDEVAEEKTEDIGEEVFEDSPRDLDNYMEEVDKEATETDNGFIIRLLSNDPEVVTQLGKDSDRFRIKLIKEDFSDEPTKKLSELFKNNKENMSYDYEEFDNGVIRKFESEDEKIVEELHKICELFSKEFEKEGEAEETE